MRGNTLWGLAWLAAVGALSVGGAALPTRSPEPDSAPVQAPRVRGAKVTFERVRGGDGPDTHSQLARLLSLAVERGETPTPFLPPGAFRARFETTVTLPARDRMSFRIDGRGSATLTINGEKVLDGQLRSGKSLETDKPMRLKKGDNDVVLRFESTAMGDGELRLFWSGVDFGFEPIAPELLSTVADDADVQRGDRLRMGHELFVERRCARCHEYEQLRIGESAFAELDIAGPDLRQVASRVKPGFLAAWMHDPRAVRPDARMPRFALSDAEVQDVAAYLAGLGSALPGAAADPKLVADGKLRFRERGCVACHAAPGEDPADARIGDRIPLSFVGQKWHGRALVTYLQRPDEHYPDVRMPDLKLSLEDAQALAAYLLDGAQDLPAPTGDAKRGRRLVQNHGCYLCHALGDDVPIGDRVFPLLPNVKADRGCLAEEPRKSGAPDHGLSQEQRAALREFLPFAVDVPFRRSPLDYVARHLRADRCDACHAIDGEPSTWARIVERLSATEPLPKEQDPVAQGVPALTWVGAKLQPSWIEKFVQGKLPSPRPWLTARMPAFAKHGAVLAAGLVREHGYGGRDEPPTPANAQLSIHGERLVAQGSGFGCVQCHALGGKPAVQVFEREGIDLVTARGRLRHEYYTRWLADPPRLDPDARMPKYADQNGKTPFTDVLDGDGARQFEAIWQYLGGLQRR